MSFHPQVGLVFGEQHARFAGHEIADVRDAAVAELICVTARGAPWSLVEKRMKARLTGERVPSLVCANASQVAVVAGQGLHRLQDSDGSKERH